MSTSRGRKDYRMSVVEWKRTQPKVKKPSTMERLDAKRTASEKERKSRNPEQLKVSYNKKARKVERTIEDNPNYERPTEGQRGYSKDTNPSQGAAVDMDKVKDIISKSNDEAQKTLKDQGSGIHGQFLPSNPQLMTQSSKTHADRGLRQNQREHLNKGKSSDLRGNQLKIKKGPKGPEGKIGKIMGNKSLDSAAKLKELNKLKKSSAMFQRGGMAHKLRLAQFSLGR